MEPLKLDYDVDIVVGPTKITEADKAAFRQAFAERRKAPGYAERVAALDRTIERIEKAQAKNRAKERRLANSSPQGRRRKAGVREEARRHAKSSIKKNAGLLRRLA